MRKRDRWNIDTIDLTTQRQQPEQKKDESRAVGFIKCHWKHALIILGVLYLITVVFGIASMRYYYDEDGNRRLYRLTFSDMQLQDDYDVLTEQLDDVRKLMVDVAIVDIHLANGKYTNYEAATLYTSVLDDKLDVMIPKVTSMNLQNEQEPIRETMESLLSYDLALYLQNISSGLKSGDATTVNTALQYREKWLKTYEILEADIMKLSEKLKLNDEKYYEWDLYKAVEKKDSSAVLIPRTEDANER